MLSFHTSSFQQRLHGHSSSAVVITLRFTPSISKTAQWGGETEAQRGKIHDKMNGSVPLCLAPCNALYTIHSLKPHQPSETGRF